MRRKGESESRYVTRRLRELEAAKKIKTGWKFNKWDRSPKEMDVA